jgi:hypothetical protein
MTEKRLLSASIGFLQHLLERWLSSSVSCVWSGLYWEYLALIGKGRNLWKAGLKGEYPEGKNEKHGN